MSSDHDELLSKCEIHLAYVGNGLFCELKPRLSGTTTVSGTTMQDVNLTGTTVSADSGTTTRDVKITGGNTDTSSTACGNEETVPYDVPDGSDVKPPSLLDIPEVPNITSTTPHVAVIGSITPDAKTLHVLLAANDGKLRPTDAPSTVISTKNVSLSPPVTREHQPEHITQSQVIIKDIQINLKRISQTDLELWTKPKPTTYYKSPISISTQRSQVAKSIKTLKAKTTVTLIKDILSNQKGTQRNRKSIIKKRQGPHATTKNRNNSKRWDSSKFNRTDTATLSSRRTRTQQIHVGAKSPVFQLTVHGLKKYKHRYHYKCTVISCARRFSTVRDWNNHHRNFHKTILRCRDCRKGFKTLSAHRDHVYTHKQQQLTCRKCNKKFCFPSSLQVHMISHLTKRLHKCCAAGCKEEYKYKQDLLQHIKQHEHTSFKCDQCEY